MKHWSIWDLRHFCIDHNYYTHGTNGAYSAMFEFVDTHEPTPENIELVVMDIVIHSDMNHYNPENLELVRSQLLAEVIR